MNKLLELSKIFERFIDKKKGLKKVLTSLGIDETAYNKLPIADKLKIMEASKKVKGGMGMMDAAALVGIPYAMSKAYKMPVQDDTEEMAKYTAELDKRADKFRDLYGRTVDVSPRTLPYTFAAQGGRIGYAGGGAQHYADLYSKYAQDMIKDGITPMDIEDFIKMIKKQGHAQGGRIGAQEGGLMDLGGMEKDYRQEGGFVPLGGEEKADDVPARLSKNEFVFTADAVRAAGGGDIDAGAEVMENVMENLEAGGKVSEESQGLEGARGMFANAQALEKRII